MALRLLKSATATVIRHSTKITRSTCTKTNIPSIARPCLPKSCLATSCIKYGDGGGGGLQVTDWGYNDPSTIDLENVVGPMHEELEAMYEDDLGDPFEQDPNDHPIEYGTKENPVLVPTNAHERMVACLCGEGERDSPEAEPICIMLTFDEGMDTARCFDCGCWYKLVAGNPFPLMEAFDEIEDTGDHHH